MDTFGEWLQQQRRQRKLTRDEFAKRIGCSVSALQKIEYGERRPSAQIAELIANCLGFPPAEHSTFVRVARGELGVDRLRPDLRLVTPPDNFPPRINLPAFATPLIGRERELEQLGQLLHDPQCRLVTLVGPGGIGKTRLAVEAAANMQAVFDHGVSFVPLASAASINAVISTIAKSIHFDFYGRRDPWVQLLDYCRDKRVLLIADNLEHLLARESDGKTVAELLVEILGQAPQVKLLITSRESLELQVEWVYEVAGLPIPEYVAVEESAHNTSVELFLQRARRARAGFSAGITDYPSIARICRLVEGNPLGIELAAAWVRALSCNEIAKQIELGLDFLSVTTRDLPIRHRSMRAVFDHSWQLLPEEERLVLARMSVFQGRFQREAAEHIAGATLATLSTLIAKSLVRRSGENCYDLHELVRQFAAEHLAKSSDEHIAIQNRHSNYYLTSFSRADARLRGPAQREVLRELSTEMDNFRAAWDWAAAKGEFALIEPTMRPFKMFYDVNGWFQEGLDTLDRTVNALEMVHGHEPSDRANRAALGHMLAVRSWLAYRLAYDERSQAMLERSVAILRPLDEPHALVESITNLGWALELIGNHDRALELYSEGREIAMAIGDRWHATLCLTLHTALAGSKPGMVRPELTHERLQSVVADWRLIGDPRLTAFALNFLSQSALRLGRYDDAYAALEENVALNSSIGFSWGLGSAYRGLGLVAQAQGEHQQAVRVFQNSLDILAKLGARHEMARVLAEMGWSIFELGDDAEAERKWRRALRIATETHGTFVVLDVLVGLASLRAKRGERALALEPLWFVLNHPACLKETRVRAGDRWDELAGQLARRQIEDAEQRAKAKSLETIVAELLK